MGVREHPAAAGDGDLVERWSEEPRGRAALDDRLHALLNASGGQQLVVVWRDAVGREDVAQEDREAGVHRVDGKRAAAELDDRADLGRGAQVEHRGALDLGDDDEVVAVGVPGDEVVDRGEPEVVGAVHEPGALLGGRAGADRLDLDPRRVEQAEPMREDAEAGRHELDDAQPGHAGSSIGMTSVSPLPTATTSSSQVIRTR